MNMIPWRFVWNGQRSNTSHVMFLFYHTNTACNASCPVNGCIHTCMKLGLCLGWYGLLFPCSTYGRMATGGRNNLCWTNHEAARNHHRHHERGSKRPYQPRHSPILALIISHSSCTEQYGDMSSDTQTHTHTIKPPTAGVQLVDHTSIN